jgi:hypothetical protein
MRALEAILVTMKTIAHSFSGLASSLLLNVGLVRIAEKLEPMATGQTVIVRDPQHCGFTDLSSFPARSRN